MPQTLSEQVLSDADPTPLIAVLVGRLARDSAQLRGIGLDLILTQRIRRSLSRFGDAWIGELAAGAEAAALQNAANRLEEVSRRFAAKEAVAKALGEQGAHFQLRDLMLDPVMGCGAGAFLYTLLTPVFDGRTVGAVARSGRRVTVAVAFAMTARPKVRTAL